MGLLNKIHDHFHDDAATPDAAHHAHTKPPFWVRNYDHIVRFASLGRASKLHRGTLDLTEAQPGHHLLDVGCGTGDFLLTAESSQPGLGDLVGLDPEAGMIAQAHEKARACGSQATFVVGGIEALAYPDDTFDVVTSSLMFHHLSPEQQAAGLAEIFRVLVPGGRVVIVDLNPARRSLVTSLPGHRTADAVDTVVEHVPAQLRGAGFTVSRTGAHEYKALSYVVGLKP